MSEFLQRFFLPAILLGLAFLIITFCEPVRGEEVNKFPVKYSHTVVVYEVSGLRCVTYVNYSAYARGSSSTACVPIVQTDLGYDNVLKKLFPLKRGEAPLNILGVFENE